MITLDHNLSLEELKVGCVKNHFLDSGAFSLWTKAAKYAEEKKCGRWDYYDTEEFWSYIDSYAKFIKKYSVAIDYYANLDVIPNPELTWRNQKYLEKEHGLQPVPVVHYKTDLKWLKFYIDKGYEIIGLGGLVGSTRQEHCRAWIDRCFEIVCDTPNNLPKVKIHGFGITTYELIIRYPWWGIDSTSWTKIGAYGGILVPHKRGGKWDFSEQPYLMKVSDESPDRKSRGKHVLTMSKMEQVIIKEWLDFIGVPLGAVDKAGEVTEWGVITQHTYRKAANLLFFEELRKWLPHYPWPFQSSRRKGFWY